TAPVTQRPIATRSTTSTWAASGSERRTCASRTAARRRTAARASVELVEKIGRPTSPVATTTAAGVRCRVPVTVTAPTRGEPDRPTTRSASAQPVARAAHADGRRIVGKRDRRREGARLATARLPVGEGPADEPVDELAIGDAGDLRGLGDE